MLVDVEVFKRVLREVASSDPAFIRDVFIDALRGDGKAVEAIVDLITKNPEARLRLAEAIASAITVPLNVVTRQDLEEAVKRLRGEIVTKEEFKKETEGIRREIAGIRSEVENLRKEVTDIRGEVDDIKSRMVTREEFRREIEDIRREIEDIRNRMATKEQFERLTLDIEESARDWVSYLLGQRGYRCVAEHLWVDNSYELDIYCNAGSITVAGEAKVRAGAGIVEDVLHRAQELQHRQPDKVSGRLVPVLYTMLADPSARQRARELKVWLIENNRELVALEEALQ